ncbi:MAG: cytidylate kinase family protein [Deltaproteobacteria bacterium]|nr:cytidylate kinase family protein [Deltaproteobacteria bacterium]
MAVLTISRTYQSGGHEIGKAVARETGYDFIDKTQIFSNLKSLGEKWGRAFEESDEVTPSLWEKNDWQYRGFIALIECIIFDYALKDRVVLLGRGANFILEGIPHVLRVRLIAPLEVRVERAIIKNETARETAELLIKKTDQDRAGYIRSIYKKNWEDPEHYDLILNTADYSIDQATRKLTEALKEWDQRATAEGRKKLENQALTAKVKARIITHPEIFIPTLEVSHDGRSIVLKGVVHTPKELHLVEAVVQQMADPHPVRNELHYRK